MKDHTTYDVGNPGPMGIGAMMYSYLWWKMSDTYQTLHFRSSNAKIKNDVDIHMPHVEQELLSLPEHINSPSGF